MCKKISYGLNHCNPKLFVKSQWRIPRIVYILYRIAVALFFVVWIILSGAIKYNWASSDADRKKWFIYMTNWSFTTLTLGVIAQAVICVYDALNKRHKQPKKLQVSYPEPVQLPWCYKVTWVLYNVSSLSALMVTVLFWILLYPQYRACSGDEVLVSCGSPCTATCVDPEPVCSATCEERCQCPDSAPLWHDGECLAMDACPPGPYNQTKTYEKTALYKIHYISIMTHAGNSIYVVVNIFVTAMPMRVFHYIHYAVYAVIYTIFTVIYHLADGTNAWEHPYIYSVIDWRYPFKTSIYIVGCFVLSMVLWLVLFGITKLRVCVYRKFCAPIRSSDRTAGQDLNLMAGSGNAKVDEESTSSF